VKRGLMEATNCPLSGPLKATPPALATREGDGSDDVEAS
jgi:hypothetical protein